jgi:hypothetical protein
LQNPATFRDFSKTMGNQTARRAEIFMQRYLYGETHILGTAGNIATLFLFI